MKKHIATLLTLFLLISCNQNSPTLPQIDEIYYRELTCKCFNSNVNVFPITYRTEVLIIQSDNNGVRYLDTRSINQINSIIDEKVNQLIKNSFIFNDEPGTSKIEKFNVDFANFVLRISDLEFYNQIYKCHYDKNSKELKIKKYIVEKGDTLNTLEPNIDTSGIYFFKAGSTTNERVKLQFPNPDNPSKRDITTESIGQKQPLSYEQEIANYVQFQKNPIRKGLFDNYEKNSFALLLLEQGPNFIGGTMGISIEIVDGYAFFIFESTGGKNITYRNSRHLTEKENEMIKGTVLFSKIESYNEEFPHAINNYQSSHTQLILKNGDKKIVGGVLSPLTIQGSLARSSTDMQKIYNDCRAYTSTLKGNYDTVFKAARSTFIELDSIYRLLQPTAK